MTTIITSQYRVCRVMRRVINGGLLRLNRNDFTGASNDDNFVFLVPEGLLTGFLTDFFVTFGMILLLIIIIKSV